MKITLNNNELMLPHTISVEDFLLERNITSAGTAVAINGVVVRRADWGLRLINEGDNIILITAAYGG